MDEQEADEKKHDSSFRLGLAEEKALVGVEKVDKVPVKVRTAPHLRN
jgi:hypothetical protein